jgi:hypothetical protein
MFASNLHVLLGAYNRAHGGDVKTEQHSSHRGDDRQKVNIIDLWKLFKHLDGGELSQLKFRRQNVAT